MNRRLYAIHRWLSLIALLQLAVWVSSGLFFAAMPMKRVKGAPVEGANMLPVTADEPLVPPEAVVRDRAREGAVERIELVGSSRGPMYRGKAGSRRFRVDARSGRDSPVDAAEAELIARQDQPGQPAMRSIERIEKATHVEYRGRPLPAWRVTLADDAGTVVYVDAIMGDVTARRNDVWRLYDFLWSLHIMDYGEREAFNHPLLIVAASLGCLTVISGASLWALRLMRWLRRPRRGPRTDAPSAAQT
jgi:hypothetical protein